jgi:hypothetical protein
MDGVVWLDPFGYEWPQSAVAPRDALKALPDTQRNLSGLG